jgi:phage portal protein BeeE
VAVHHIDLRREDEVSRYSWDQYQNDLWVAFNGQRYLLSGGSGGWSKTEDLEHSFTSYVTNLYKSNGVVFAITLARLLLFAEARFCWFEIQENGEDGRPKGRSGLEVLERPWPNCGTGELLARMEQDVTLGGNFFAVREGSRLRRLRPDWVTIILTAPPAESTYSDVRGYWYHPGRSYSNAGDPGPGDEVYLPDEICHWSPLPDPEAQYRGMSWLTPVIREVMADKAARDHKLAFFENGAQFGAIISAKESLTNQQYKEWKANFEGIHTGTASAYKTLFLASPVDTSVTTANMQQLDFKVVQGAGETRLCAAGGVPPIIVGLSEGLASATYSNYGMARRKFGDHWAHPQWKSASQALSSLVDPPGEDLRLGVNTKGIAFLREDAKDLAEIQQIKASTLSTLIMGGFTPDSSVAAVEAEDLSLLEHTGLTSVQLVPPGTDPLAEEEFVEDEFADEGFEEDLEFDEELGRARYNVRNPEGSVGGGRFRKLSDAIVALLKDDADLDDFTQPQLRKAADQLGLVTPRARYSRAHLERVLREHARGDAKPVKKAAPKKAPAKKPAERLAEALAEAGWTAEPGPYGITYRDPANDREIPTPDYVTKSMWPGETYTHQRSVTIVPGGNGRPASVLIREHRTPWVTASQRPVSYKAAIEFVTADDPRPGAKVADAPKPDSVTEARDRQAAIDDARRYADAAAELDELLNNEVSDETLLHRLDARARREGIEADVADIREALTGETAREIEIENKIRAAYRAELSARGETPSSHTAFVGLADIRDALGEDYPRAEVDRVLRGMRRGDPNDPDAVRLIKIANTKALKQRDYDSALPNPGAGDDRTSQLTGGFHAIAMADPSPRPLPGDKDRARALMRDLLSRHGITQDGNAGDSGRYDPKTMQPIDGSLRQGQAVEVVRPGMVLAMPADPAKAREIEIENKIRAAYRAVRRNEALLPERLRNPSDWVSLADLRDEMLVLPGDQGDNISREDFDEAIRRLGRGDYDGPGRPFVTEETNQKALTARDRAAAVSLGGQDQHVIRFDDPSDRPLDRDGEKIRVRRTVVEAADEPGPAAELDSNPDGDAAPAPFQPVPKAHPTRDERIRALVATGMTWKQAREQVKREFDDDDTAPDLTSPDTERLRDSLDLKKIEGPDGLKAMLRERGLPVSGRKRELVDRLVGHLHPGDSPTQARQPEGRPRLTPAEAAQRIRRLTDVDDILEEIRDLRAADVRALAEEFNITIPVTAKSAAVRKRHIAQSLAAHNRRTRGGLDRSETPDPDDIERADDDPGEPDNEILRALADLTDDEFEKYWTREEGLGRWATHAHPWTTLRNLLRQIPLKHGRGPRDPEGLASHYFKVVFGIWPGERKGSNPVGPG